MTRQSKSCYSLLAAFLVTDMWKWIQYTVYLTLSGYSTYILHYLDTVHTSNIIWIQYIYLTLSGYRTHILHYLDTVHISYIIWIQNIYLSLLYRTNILPILDTVQVSYIIWIKYIYITLSGYRTYI